MVLGGGRDGGGTRLEVAHRLDIHETSGIDCVAMCANDVIVTGAAPLFFLDYVATGKLEPHVVASVVRGVAEGCVQAGCALIGGETAEMPGFYAAGTYDIAGFCVGAARREELLVRDAVRPGDTLVGVASSGFHSNGYSLVRKVVADHGLDAELGDGLGEALMRPTVMYVRPLQALRDVTEVMSAAHITGGGLFENVPRALPTGCVARIDVGTWEVPGIMERLCTLGGVEGAERYSVFNMGVGLVVVVRGGAQEGIERLSGDFGLDAWVIGSVEEADASGAPACVELVGV